MKILIFFIFLLESYYAHSDDCLATPSFLKSSKKVATAAVGSFYRYNNMLIFRPLVCLNRTICEDIVFSSYPRYIQDVNYDKLWTTGRGTQVFGKIDIIVSQDKSFEEGIENQVKHIKNYIKKKKLSKKNKSLNNFDEKTCDEKSSSILVLDNSFYNVKASWGWEIFNRENANDSFLKKFKLTYADERIKNCGCEDLFDSTKIELANIPSAIDGYYQRDDGKLYFVEESNLNSKHKYEVVRKIELEENDKCNPFVDDFLGKKIRLLTFDKIKSGVIKIRYINACRSRVEFRPMDNINFLKD